MVNKELKNEQMVYNCNNMVDRGVSGKL